MMDCLAYQEQSTFLEHMWLAFSCPWEATQSESPLPLLAKEFPPGSGCTRELQDELWMTEEQNMLAF